MHSKIANLSIKVGKSPDKQAKDSYKRRVNSDLLLPIQLKDEEENSSCVRNVSQKNKPDEACCPFFKSQRDKTNSRRNARMPNDNSDRVNAPLLGNSLSGLPIAAAALMEP